MPTMYVNVGAGQTVNIRNSKSKSVANVHGTVAHGTAVQTIGTSYESGGGYNWWPIWYDSDTRYIERTSATQFLSTSNPNSGGGSGGSGGSSGGSGNIINGHCSATSGTVNIRSGPGTNFTTVGTLVPNQSVQWYDGVTTTTSSSENNMWLKLVANTNQYVAMQYLTSNILEASPAGIVTANRNLTADEMLVNAQYIKNYLCSRGWTKTAACGALGNWEAESTLSPGRYQSGVGPGDNVPKVSHN